MIQTCGGVLQWRTPMVSSRNEKHPIGVFRGSLPEAGLLQVAGEDCSRQPIVRLVGELQCVLLVFSLQQTRANPIQVFSRGVMHLHPKRSTFLSGAQAAYDQSVKRSLTVTRTWAWPTCLPHKQVRINTST